MSSPVPERFRDEQAAVEEQIREAFRGPAWTGAHTCYWRAFDKGNTTR